MPARAAKTTSRIVVQAAHVFVSAVKVAGLVTVDGGGIFPFLVLVAFWILFAEASVGEETFGKGAGERIVSHIAVFFLFEQARWRLVC